MVRMRGLIFLACAAPVVAFAASDLKVTSPEQNRASSNALLNQVRTNKALRNRYLRHFGMTEAQLYKFISSLKLEELTGDAKLPVDLEPFGDDSVVQRQVVPKGTFVFVDPSGNPALLANSGDPLFAEGASFSEARVVDPEGMGYYLIPADSVAIPAAPVDLPNAPMSVQTVIGQDAQGSSVALQESSIGTASNAPSSFYEVMDQVNRFDDGASSANAANPMVSPMDQEELLTVQDSQQDPTDSQTTDDSKKDKSDLVVAPVNAFGSAAAGNMEFPWIGGSILYGILASTTEHSRGSTPTPAPEPVTVISLGVGAVALLKRRAKH